MNQVFKIILTAISVGVLIEMATKMFGFTISSDRVDPNSKFVDSLAASLTQMPTRVLSLVFGLIAMVIVAILNVVIGLLTFGLVKPISFESAVSPFTRDI